MWYISQVTGRKEDQGESGISMQTVLKIVGVVLLFGYIAFILKDPPAAGRLTRDVVLGTVNVVGGLFVGLAGR